MEKTLLSTVTPVYQGAATLPELVAELERVRSAWEADPAIPFRLEESIFVDDGSSDGSAGVLVRLAADRPWLRVVTLSRNFGQHPATVAGILHSCGDWVFTLDEDLQHPPAGMEGLLRQAVAERLDVVYAKPLEGVHGSAARDLTARLFKRVLVLISGNPQVRLFNSFRALRGSVARGAAAVSSHDSYFDVVLLWFTSRVGVHGLHLSDRRYVEEGRSGYSFGRLLTHARRALVSSQAKWLRLGTALGVASMLLSAVLGGGILVQKWLDPGSITVRGWPSLFLGITFFGGLTSFLLGVILEYLSTVLLKSQGKPAFFVVDRSVDERIDAYFRARQDDGDPVS